MKPHDDASPSDLPWVADGRCSPEYEDLLIGNRAGLERLRQSIDAALADGECRIEEPDVEFIGVRVVDVDPRRSEPESDKPTPKQRVTSWGCLLAAFVLIFVLIAGLIQIVSWFR